MDDEITAYQDNITKGRPTCNTVDSGAHGPSVYTTIIVGSIGIRVQ